PKVDLSVGEDGAGGIGVLADDVRIVNKGSIVGGLGGDGVTRASAVRFNTGSDNRLELHPGSTVVGAVEIGPGASATLQTIAPAMGNSAIQLGSLVLGGNGIVDTAGSTVLITPFAGVSGAGSLEKTGPGKLELWGINTYGGGTLLRQGELSIGQDESFGAIGATLVIDGGTLSVPQPLLIYRPVVLGAGGATLDINDEQLGLGGTISGSGGLVKEGSGVLMLLRSSASSYTGSTHVREGTLRTHGPGLLSPASAMVLDAGTLLNLNGHDQVSASLEGAGEVFLSIGNYTVGDDSSTRFDGTITGRGSIVKTGSGTLYLSGVNEQSGGTKIEGGRVTIEQDRNLGARGATLVIDGGTLGVAQTTALDRPVVLGAGGATLDTTDASLGLAGGVSGTGGLVKEGSEFLIFQGDTASSYSGSTHVRKGTLRTNGADLLSPTSAMVLDSGTRLNLNNHDQVSASIEGTGEVNLGSAVYTVGDDRSTRFGGAIAGSGQLRKQGAGTLTLDGTSTFNGGTMLKQGRIDVGSAAALGSGPLAMDDNTTLGFTADGLVLANDIVLTGSNDPVIDTGAMTETLNGVISVMARVSITGSLLPVSTMSFASTSPSAVKPR
ncbi:MAG: hypothetical protein EOO22_15125, partial [Comamonadaceae bacterium]